LKIREVSHRRWRIGAEGATHAVGVGAEQQAPVRGATLRLFLQEVGRVGFDGKKRAKKQNGRLLQGRMWDAVPALR